MKTAVGSKKVGGRMLGGVARVILCAMAAAFCVGCGGDKGTNPGSSDPGTEIKGGRVGKTDDGHDVLVFPQGELDNVLLEFNITDQPDSGYTGHTGTLVFSNLDSDKIPVVGDILASEPTPNAENGFLVKILDVSTDGGITTAAFRNASLTEAIENVDFKSETVLEFDDEGSLKRMLRKTNGKSNGIVFYDTISVAPGGSEITTETAFSMKLIFDLNIVKRKVKSAKIAVYKEEEFKLGGALKLKVEYDSVFNLWTVPLPTIKFAVGLIPVVITNQMDIGVKLSSEAEFGLKMEASVKASGEYGFEYYGDAVHMVNRPKFDEDFDVEQYISGEIVIASVFGIKSKLYGAAGISLIVGPALKLEAKSSPFGVHVYDTGFVNSHAENGFKLGLGVVYGAEVIMEAFDKTLDSHKLKEGYIEIKQLISASCLPSFDNPVIATDNNGIFFTSAIVREKWDYPVLEYGICVERPESNECKNGRGKRRTFFGPVKTGETRSFSGNVGGLETGPYHARLFFSLGDDVGIFYDKTTSFSYGAPECPTCKYTLIGKSNPTGGGSVSPSRLLDDISERSSRVISATPADGYAFVGWTVEGEGSTIGDKESASTFVIVNSNTTVIANFVTLESLKKYNLMVNREPPEGGSVLPGAPEFGISAGTTRNITATPKSGYTFAKWTVTGHGSTIADPNSASTTVTVNGSDTVTAHFIPDKPTGTSFTDVRDGQSYRMVTIGTQTWMAENLNYDVPSSTRDVCYNKNSDNCSIYGRLYTWDDATSVCPVGWHLPSDDEWTTLEDFVGDSATAGTKLKSKSGWGGVYDWNGTDLYGFSALPGGFGGSDGGSFSYVGTFGSWWSATEGGTGTAYCRMMSGTALGYRVERSEAGTRRLFSVRCVQN